MADGSGALAPDDAEVGRKRASLGLGRGGAPARALRAEARQAALLEGVGACAEARQAALLDGVCECAEYTDSSSMIVDDR